MSRILALREKAKKNVKRIVLPESDDKRVVKAASFLAKERIADVTLLGRRNEIEAFAGANSISLDRVNVMDPAACDKLDEAVKAYYEARKHKGITPDEARKNILENNVNFAAIMTRLGVFDGFVAGAKYTTSKVARAALHCLNLDMETGGIVSSSFIMEIENSAFGSNGLFAFGDCAIIPYPTPEQLAGIAMSTSNVFKKLFDVEPRVALLSYSTKGSAEGVSAATIKKALEIVKIKMPDLIIDGELQADSAIVPEVAKTKCPDSPVGGKANVLIFPTLDAGNISYKLIQRLSGARAVGPIIQGLDKPCADLSRGCSWEDVVDTVALVAVRSQGDSKNEGRGTREEGRGASVHRPSSIVPRCM